MWCRNGVKGPEAIGGRLLWDPGRTMYSRCGRGPFEQVLVPILLSVGDSILNVCVWPECVQHRLSTEHLCAWGNLMSMRRAHPTPAGGHQAPDGPLCPLP